MQDWYPTLTQCGKRVMKLTFRETERKNLSGLISANSALLTFNLQPFNMTTFTTLENFGHSSSAIVSYSTALCR